MKILLLGKDGQVGWGTATQPGLVGAGLSLENPSIPAIDHRCLLHPGQVPDQLLHVQETHEK
jgi:hypothetical protein